MKQSIIAIILLDENISITIISMCLHGFDWGMYSKKRRRIQALCLSSKKKIGKVWIMVSGRWGRSSLSQKNPPLVSVSISKSFCALHPKLICKLAKVPKPIRCLSECCHLEESWRPSPCQKKKKRSPSPGQPLAAQPLGDERDRARRKWQMGWGTSG